MKNLVIVISLILTSSMSFARSPLRLTLQDRLEIKSERMVKRIANNSCSEKLQNIFKSAQIEMLEVEKEPYYPEYFTYMLTKHKDGVTCETVFYTEENKSRPLGLKTKVPGFWVACYKKGKKIIEKSEKNILCGRN